MNQRPPVQAFQSATREGVLTHNLQKRQKADPFTAVSKSKYAQLAVERLVGKHVYVNGKTITSQSFSCSFIIKINKELARCKPVRAPVGKPVVKRPRLVGYPIVPQECWNPVQPNPKHYVQKIVFGRIASLSNFLTVKPTENKLGKDWLRVKRMQWQLTRQTWKSDLLLRLEVACRPRPLLPPVNSLALTIPEIQLKLSSIYSKKWRNQLHRAAGLFSIDRLHLRGETSTKIPNSVEATSKIRPRRTPTESLLGRALPSPDKGPHEVDRPNSYPAPLVGPKVQTDADWLPFGTCSYVWIQTQDHEQRHVGASPPGHDTRQLVNFRITENQEAGGLTSYSDKDKPTRTFTY
ncbi:hypothetical protein T265_03087 [Opisthorchis viverrini]|uniref:Uncharacterized protein n=1 Tax=Opisthorchis viverrini TaxID=6198 RepID=A0A075A4G0_OPIVI|nr:hypothetical protein T265_03087 [Opisthorchis viverrini]KER30475.1 hypothetical protein T265_03087 [Opisthorchis viverrini]